MLGVTIGSLVAGVGNGNVTQQKEGLHIGRVTVVVARHDTADAAHGSGAAHIGPDHGPAIGTQVTLQLLDLTGERGGHGIVHQQDHLTPMVDRRHFDARGDVSIARDATCHAHDTIFVGGADRHTVVLVLRGRRGYGGQGATPSIGGQRLSVDRDGAGARHARPIDRDPRRGRLDRCRQLDRRPFRTGLCECRS